MKKSTTNLMIFAVLVVLALFLLRTFSVAQADEPRLSLSEIKVLSGCSGTSTAEVRVLCKGSVDQARAAAGIGTEAKIPKSSNFYCIEDYAQVALGCEPGIDRWSLQSLLRGQNPTPKSVEDGRRVRLYPKDWTLTVDGVMYPKEQVELNIDIWHQRYSGRVESLQGYWQNDARLEIWFSEIPNCEGFMLKGDWHIHCEPTITATTTTLYTTTTAPTGPTTTIPGTNGGVDYFPLIAVLVIVGVVGFMVIK